MFLTCIIYSQKYSVQSYNTDNGLPQNSVKDIIKDKYDFIWLTTENGIVRYDGVNFLTYKNFPLRSQRFTYFYGNPEKDSIFTSGDFSKIILVHQKKPKVIDPIRKYTIVIRKDYIHYFLYFSHYSYTTSPGIHLYMNFKDGRYYIKENELLYTDFHSKDEKKLTVKAIYKSVPRIFAINETLFQIDFSSRKVRQIEKGEIVNSHDVPLLTDINSRILWSRINNQVFIVNNDTVYTCSYEKGQLKISRLIRINNINKDNLVSIFYDKYYRKLYLGSGTNGLKIISLHDFTAVKRPPSKPESIFYSSLPYSNSSVITTFGEIYNKDGLVEDKSYKNLNPYFLSYDHSGNVIAHKIESVIGYKSPTLNENTSFDILNGCTIKDFFFDNERYYSLIVKFKKGEETGYDGILTIHKDQSFKSAEKTFFFKIEPTTFIRQDNDNILVGTINGLYKVSIKTNKIYKIPSENEMSIRDIIRSSDGNFWVTTLGKGFYLLKNDRLIKMPYDIQGNIASSHTILEDRKGFFWIPTNNGLYRIRESRLLQYSHNQNTKIDYYKFSKDSGFNTNEFNGGGNICGNKLVNGEFVLPSLDGLVFYDPLKVKAYYPQNLYVERALVDNKFMDFNNELHIKQENTRIDILIDIPYYGNPDNVVVEAKLGGIPNTKWESIGNDRKFSISNLGYGDHTLVIRMLTSDNGKYTYKKINIIIPPYFYQTIWFKILSSVFLLLTLYFLIKWRTHFLKKRNHELEKIINARTQSLSDTVGKLEMTKIKLSKEIEQQKKLIGTITHDITTPVKFIALTAKEILDNKDFDSQRTEKVFNSIYKSSDQLYNFTITLKEYADIYSHHRSDKSELYSLSRLVEEKITLFSTIAEGNNTVIINNLNKELDTWISKNILSAIIHNLLDNCVKFTKNGTITVEGNMENDTIVLLIKDTGIGMDEKKMEYYTSLQHDIENEKLLLQKYGMGLHLVLQLLQMIEGKIIFEKNNPSGTSFKLILTNKKDA